MRKPRPNLSPARNPTLRVWKKNRPCRRHCIVSALRGSAAVGHVRYMRRESVECRGGGVSEHPGGSHSLRMNLPQRIQGWISLGQNGYVLDRCGDLLMQEGLDVDCHSTDAETTLSQPDRLQAPCCAPLQLCADSGKCYLIAKVCSRIQYRSGTKIHRWKLSHDLSTHPQSKAFWHSRFFDLHYGLTSRPTRGGGRGRKSQRQACESLSSWRFHAPAAPDPPSQSGR